MNASTVSTGAGGPYVGRTFGPMYLPAVFPSNEAFLGVFEANLDRVTALLPSDELFPVRTRPGWAALAVSGMYFPTHATRDPAGGDSTCPAYGEVTISVLCTPGTPARALLPLTELGSRPGWHFHVFPLHVPVTTVQAWEGGRMICNAPKFVADMRFEIGTRACAVSLDEGGERILRLQTRRGGLTQHEDGDLVGYSAQDGRLMRTRFPVVGIRQTRPGIGAGGLELGGHPIADQLRDLQVGPTPLVVRTYLRHTLTMLAPEPVGPARRYDGWLHPGMPEPGSLHVVYESLPPIDIPAITLDRGGDPTLPTQVPAPA